MVKLFKLLNDIIIVTAKKKQKKQIKTKENTIHTKQWFGLIH